MKGAVSGMDRRLTHGELLECEKVIQVIDRIATDMNRKWGHGRLVSLVPVDWAGKFARQSQKFSNACFDWDLPEVRKHGEALERAYQKLDQLAEEAGAERGKPEQWEFEVEGELVILVQDRNRMNQVDTQGRKAQVWSIDEICEILSKYPTLRAAKSAFPGAEIVSINPAPAIQQKLNDDLDGLPFGAAK